MSSTFRDMQAEREELVKRVFPRLRKLCETRGVTWGEVDLRWGVTDEQKAEGKVLPLCLEEVRRCRPYFIGLLGSRYGWVPGDFEPAILAEEPWLANYRGRSVTEIEIACGVLDDPAMADHAYFYFRDPGGEAEAGEPSGSETAKRLELLKERIRKASLPVWENYRSAREFGEHVLSDFSALIERLFPQGDVPNALDREAARHVTFAASRARAYIGRPSCFARLDDQVAADGQPLVVTGESGVGKSALLANWSASYRQRHPEVLVLSHFLGASPASADWRALVRRLLGELDRYFALSLTIPDDPVALRAALAKTLRRVGAEHRIVIVLDGLNQLDDAPQGRDLVWLPRDLPPGIRILASALPSDVLEEIDRRDWLRFELTSLDDGERRALIGAYLSQYAKALPHHQVAAIAGAPLSGNPLFLVALLEELRLWGEHESLRARIDHYLRATSLADLFQRILARYERDYETDRPGLVRDAMSAIWAARQGLSEAELLDLLGTGDEPLPARHWSPLHLAADHALVDHAGILGFFHDYLRQAVVERYLPGEDDRRAAHLKLADYFAARDLGPRKVAELPWQIAKVGAWQRLADLLGDLSFLEAAWNPDGYDVRNYWTQVVKHLPDAPLQAYRPVFEHPNRHSAMLYLVSLLLLRLNFAKESLSLQGGMLDLFDRFTADNPQAFDPRVFVSLSIEASANYRAIGNHETALSMVRMAEAVAQRSGDAFCQAASLGAAATLACDEERFDQAEGLFERAEAFAVMLDDKTLLGQALNNRANLVMRRDPHAALAILSDVEQLLREAGDKETLSACLGTQGYALMRLGQIEAALKKHQEQERICREIGFMQGLQNALSAQGLAAASQGDGNGALALFAQQEAVSRRLGDKKALMRALLLQASLTAQYRSEPDAVLVLAREHESLCRELDARRDLAEGLLVQARVLSGERDHAAALGKVKESESIWQELHDSRGLCLSYFVRSECLEAAGKHVEAMQSLKAAEGLARDTGDHQSIIQALRDQAMLYARMMRMPLVAIPGLEEAEALAKSHGLASLAREIREIADRIRSASA